MTTAEATQRWDLSRFYDSPTDPRIGADLASSRAEAKALRERYYGKLAGLSPAGLREAIVALESHANTMGGIGAYAMLAFSENTNDDARKALFTRIRLEFTEIQNQLQFFDLELQAVPEAVYEGFLAAAELENYRYYLERVRKFRPHTLSESEEQIVSIKDVTGQQAWSQLYTEVTSAMTVRVALPDGEREMSLTEARTLRSDPDRRVRKAAHDAVFKAHADQSHVLSYIFNTLYEDHRQTTALRHYDNPMAPTLVEEDLAPEVVEALMSAVESAYPLAQRYYALKAKVLGLADFASHDVSAPYAEASPEVPYEEAKRLVLESFASFSPRFEEAARGFFDGRYIDVPPAPGKQGGAFCSGMRPGLHPYVLLNYQGKQRDVSVLAHELGHGIHFLFAGEAQTYFNYYPITPLAETASTFAEMITLSRLITLETDPQVKRQLLASRIEDAITTIMRQVMYTRWEQRAHAARAEGVVPAETFCRLWAEEGKRLYGDAVPPNPHDDWGWITIPHLVKFRFYCYSYAFGLLLVYALYQQYREEGEAFVPKLFDVLAAGGSAPAEVILGRIGVDIKDPGFWRKGLKALEAMLDEFESAVAG